LVFYSVCILGGGLHGSTSRYIQNELKQRTGDSEYRINFTCLTAHQLFHGYHKIDSTCVHAETHKRLRKSYYTRSKSR